MGPLHQVCRVTQNAATLNRLELCPFNLCLGSGFDSLIDNDLCRTMQAGNDFAGGRIDHIKSTSCCVFNIKDAPGGRVRFIAVDDAARPGIGSTGGRHAG